MSMCLLLTIANVIFKWSSLQFNLSELLFWVAHDIAVLWTKLYSFGNLVPKIATSQGITNLFLLSCTCCQLLIICLQNFYFFNGRDNFSQKSLMERAILVTWVTRLYFEHGCNTLNCYFDLRNKTDLYPSRWQLCHLKNSNGGAQVYLYISLVDLVLGNTEANSNFLRWKSFELNELTLCKNK